MKTVSIFEAKDINVDSGIIFICDAKYYEPYSIKMEEFKNAYTYEAGVGHYRATWEMFDTYNGPIKGQEELELKSGIMIVSDPCYIVKDWDKFLKEHFIMVGNQYRVIRPNGAILINRQGGDGTFKINFQLERI